MTPRSLLLAAFFLVSAQALEAQMEHEHSGTPPATLGRVTFATSCAAGAQPVFERGVALLHSFWYEEAARTFREAAAADTACAMAYWALVDVVVLPGRRRAERPCARHRRGTGLKLRG